MSFFQEVRSIWKRVRGVAKAKVAVREEIAGQGHGVDLSDKDKAVVAVAERNFQTIYPTPNIGKTVNFSSIMNAFVSGASTISLASSCALVGIFSYSAMHGGLGLLAGGVELTTYLSNLLMYSTICGSTYMASKFLRQLDRDITMNHCIALAEDKLKNKQIRYKEELRLEIESIGEATTIELLPHMEVLEQLQAAADAALYAIKNIEKNEDADPVQKENTIARLEKSRNEIYVRIEQVGQLIDEIEERGKKDIGNAKIRRALIHLLPSKETLDNIRSGDLDSQIAELATEARYRLDTIRAAGEEMKDSMLIDAGLEDEGNLQLPAVEARKQLE